MYNDDKPREKMMLEGVSVLTNVELLAILLRTGTKSYHVLELSTLILDKIAHISHFKSVTVEELMQIKGVKLAKSATIIAAIELGRRLVEQKHLYKIKFKTLDDVYQYLRFDLSNLEQEHFVCLYLDNKSQMIKRETIFIGTINQLVIHPRDIFKIAVRVNASFVIFVHNHPSGDSTPSESDLKTTKHLSQIGQMLGIEVVDHLIIGDLEYYSIKANKKYKP